MSKNVYIEGYHGSYATMWARWGWAVTEFIDEADVIQFTGGEDVDPSLYGEVDHPQSYYNWTRDKHCISIYKIGLAEGVPMVGICRGGQFLNVMNGGRMFQHCDGHAIGGTHKATILESGLVVDVTSTHHQIMRPNRDTGIVLMEADKLGTFKEYMAPVEPLSLLDHIVSKPEADDCEAIYYPDTNSLCYQPHAEFVDFNHDCQKVYRYFIRNYVGLDVP